MGLNEPERSDFGDNLKEFEQQNCRFFFCWKLLFTCFNYIRDIP